MASLASAFPILPGKTEEWKRFASELLGSRRGEYEASRHRLGMTREASYLQQTPQGDLVLLYTEGADLVKVFQGLGTSQDPFDVWFRQRVKDIHGFDLSQPPAGPPPQAYHDWKAS